MSLSLQLSIREKMNAKFLILLSNKLKSRTLVFLRSSVAPDVNCILTHLIGGSPSGCLTSIFTVGVAWLAGYLDFGKLGLINLDCLT